MLFPKQILAVGVLADLVPGSEALYRPLFILLVLCSLTAWLILSEVAHVKIQHALYMSYVMHDVHVSHDVYVMHDIDAYLLVHAFQCRSI